MRRKISDEEWKEIVRLYTDCEFTCDQIAARMGKVTPSSISRNLKKAGLIRSNSEAQAVRASKDVFGNERFGLKGAFHSRKNGTWYATDSAYEYARLIQHEDNAAVASWRRCTDRIPYDFGGVARKYVPDFEVTYTNGRITVEEVKPAKFVARADNVAKFQAALRFYDGGPFLVVTESEIGQKLIDSVAGHLSGIPEDVRRRRRIEAAQRYVAKMSPERHAEYLLAARNRERRKRSNNRTLYNAYCRNLRAKQRAVDASARAEA